MAKVKSWKLKATPELIRNSTPGNSRHCLIADIVRNQVPFSYSIDVRDGWVRFNVGDDIEITGIRYAYPLPGQALEAQRLLDEGKKSAIKPFPFFLDGREGFSKEVVKTGPRTRPYKPRKKTAKKRKTGARRCPVRRYRGLSAVSKGAE